MGSQILQLVYHTQRYGWYRLSVMLFLTSGVVALAGEAR